MVDVREGRGTQNRNQERLNSGYRQQHGHQRSCDPDRREVLSEQAPGRPPSQAPYGNHSEVIHARAGSRSIQRRQAAKVA